MGKTLKYGGFDFPKGNRIMVRPHTSRARPKEPSVKELVRVGETGRPELIPEARGATPMCTGGKVKRMADGGAVDPNTRVYGALNQLRPEPDPSALGGGSTGLGGPGSAQNRHEVNQIHAGHAPLTAAGVSAALQNAANVALGGTAAVQAALATGAERAFGQDPGSLGGLQDVPGQHPYSPAERAFIEAGGTAQAALARSAAERAADAAAVTARGQRGVGAPRGDGGGRFDSHGNVRGESNAGAWGGSGEKLKRGGRVGRRF